MSTAVAVVVGAGPGLGSALGTVFARGGMTVALVRRDAARIEDHAKRIGGRAYACDATDAAAVDAIFERIGTELGVPALVVYNAGAYQRGAILELEPADLERCWRIGCLGGLHVGQAAARAMLPAGGGTIIFTGATASLRGGAGFAGLAVPKFGLRALAQSMARELGPEGVHVAHVIIDGQIASDRPGYRPAERGEDAVLAPQAIAEAYWHLHTQPRSAWTQELDLRPWVEKF